MTAELRLAEPDDPPRTARFGVFELDLRTAELRRDGVLVKLQEQPFRLLVYLLERAGDVVTREELQKALWPSEFVDFDHSLNTAVRKLRTALDDSAENPRFVETLARRGYRFIAPVQCRAGSPTRPPERGGLENPPYMRWMAIAILVAGVVAFVMLRRPPIADVAVLPFTNDTRDWHVSDGLTEILIDRLSRLSKLRVMARSTSFNYRHGNPAEAGRKLGVGAVVTGQLHTEANGYRIHVELIDTRDGTQLWGESYTASAGELPTVQDRIADDLSRRLRGEPRPVSRAYTQNSRANEEYLQGLYAWNRRGREDLLQSIAHFNRAIELDPKFAAAYSGLANAYGVMGGNGLLDPKEASVNVLTAAHKALELDPNNAEAYTSIATASYRTLFDFAGAERDYRRSIELNPNYATAHQWYSQYLREMGRVDEARREIDVALKLDPLSRPINAGACFGLLLDRRYRDAAAFARNSETLGRPLPQCAARAELALQDDPLTRKTLVQARLKTLLAEPDVEFAFPVEVAECYAILGDPDQAFAWLSKAVERRATHATSFHLFAGFDPIRRDPRFAELVRRVGLPEAAYQ